MASARERATETVTVTDAVRVPDVRLPPSHTSVPAVSRVSMQKEGGEGTGERPEVQKEIKKPRGRGVSY